VPDHLYRAGERDQRDDRSLLFGRLDAHDELWIVLPDSPEPSFSSNDDRGDAQPIIRERRWLDDVHGDGDGFIRDPHLSHGHHLMERRWRRGFIKFLELHSFIH
jgi:hypothetical protein